MSKHTQMRVRDDSSVPEFLSHLLSNELYTKIGNSLYHVIHENACATSSRKTEF